MELNSVLLESWDRQSRITKAVAERVDESNKGARPSDDGWPLYQQLAHIHQVRRFHLYELDPAAATALPKAFANGWDDPVEDIHELRSMLDASSRAVRAALEKTLEQGDSASKAYDHPVYFLDHLVFHEGWHVGLIFLALRQAGQEVPEPWEEKFVWGEWRTD